MSESDRKIFVLDTSVIIFDHEAVENFAEHDVAIPMTVLEELDGFKKGNDIKNFEARQFIRFIDSISKESLLQNWVPINGPGKGNFRVIPPNSGRGEAEKIFGDAKPDHRILDAALFLKSSEPNRKVVLVTKDIALRLKAKALNLQAEDYLTGKISDLSKLNSSKSFLENIESEVIDQLFEQGHTAAISLDDDRKLRNHFLILKNGKKSALARFNLANKRIERVEKRPVFGILPRNAEQTFAIDALLDPNIMLVAIEGGAGTGKTLLALACALEQRKKFHQIYVSRPVVPLSNKDMGYLPGDIQSKLNPYLEPLWDNLRFIKNQFGERNKEAKLIDEMLKNEKIAIAPLSYIRGRSLSNVFFIVDEAQNLTPHEVKTIITRAGENTKMVFTGDIHQIDTPYLDAHSNGLSYLIDRLKSSPLFAHITLEKGERSELANLANDLL